MIVSFELRTGRGKAYMTYDSERRARDEKSRAERVMKSPLTLVKVTTYREEEVLA